MPGTPDDYRAWIGIARDAVLVVVGTFLLIWQCVVASSPNPYLIGAGLTALGVPSAFRLDLGKKKVDGGT